MALDANDIVEIEVVIKGTYKARRGDYSPEQPFFTNEEIVQIDREQFEDCQISVEDVLTWLEDDSLDVIFTAVAK